MSTNQPLGDLLAAIAVQRKAIRSTREELVPGSAQAALVIRDAYQFARPGEAGAGKPASDAVLKNVQAIDAALQTIDLHLGQIAAHVRRAAQTVEEAEAQRKHAASAYRI